jgi:hypothetical protein
MATEMCHAIYKNQKMLKIPLLLYLPLPLPPILLLLCCPVSADDKWFSWEKEELWYTQE